MAKKKKFRTEKWKGMEKYVCTVCGADSLRREAMEEHYQREHETPKREPVTVEILDRFGNPITEKEV